MIFFNRQRHFSILVLLMYVTAGCATTQQDGSAQQTEVALESIVSAISGQDIGQEELKDLAQQMQSDPEAQEAVEAISGTMLPGGSAVKYCPVTGKRYSSRLEKCPEHEVFLKAVDGN